MIFIKSYYPISDQNSHFIPPGNTRKPLVKNKDTKTTSNLVSLLLLWTDLRHYFGVFIVDFDQLNTSWVQITVKSQQLRQLNVLASLFLNQYSKSLNGVQLLTQELNHINIFFLDTSLHVLFPSQDVMNPIFFVNELRKKLIYLRKWPDSFFPNTRWKGLKKNLKILSTH